ncbi:MAG TPA: DUF4336 domain-containing protein [Nostocaceae cyanobacterium]|nr:DUF4336 domain-containing protein [Nostocaceae cyanobacterium]
MKSQGSNLSVQTGNWSWPFWPALPLYPYGKRRTIRREIVKDTIWTFEQLQGIIYTVVPIRMTVVRLKAGGLLVYAPVAPTPECVSLVRELEAKHGAVKYIILSTSSGLEHKIFVGPFARKFPQALVFTAPHQWSFPFNLPLSWLGFPAQRTQELPLDSHLTPFADEFDYAILDIDLGRGAFVEVAMFHKESQTLLVTDSVISIPEEPPEIIQLDPYPLLFHARDNAFQVIKDTVANRRQGWQRISLFAIYFRPSAVEIGTIGQMLSDARKAPNRDQKAYFGLYPFEWQADWQQYFQALRRDGQPFVAPILQVLILVQAPKQVLNWADKVASWDFKQIVPCHFDAPFAATPQQFRQAFAFLEPQPLANEESKNPWIEADLKFIRDLEANLLKLGIATPVRESIGG